MEPVTPAAAQALGSTDTATAALDPIRWVIFVATDRPRAAVETTVRRVRELPERPPTAGSFGIG
jgi:hypothetical protein